MSKTIVEKLNLRKYKKAVVLNEPAGEELLAGLEEYETELKEGPYDLIFAFVLEMEALQGMMKEVIDNSYLNKNGYFYAAYPKKGNKVYPTYIHRDHLFEGLGADEDGYIGTSSIKFARMVGLNEVFTVVGFKEEARKSQTSAKPSQSVDDYIAMIPDIEKDLHDTPESLAFYQSLTPGYQKDWARYVYSAVQEETREKRRAEMKTVLGEGYKSIDLYRRK
ncbi:YdeI/OmpD-associated family protein [Paenibacillus sp. N4]|uniref:YdeI/OmpD-associated family protein n=1 Tax=Paenibacillus vietnamensis TaxID=2590547 RepID=UPI001CD0FA50|nr:YdeI/OmpD-associated family protein [Paenibacillus vietnamensis]MCA0756301.1 YdeI/OmpD-associated family protein [Paenibacillus vietnamensis]